LTSNPELVEFERAIDALRTHPLLSQHIRRGELMLGNLSLEDVNKLLRDDAGKYFLLAGAQLSRTTLKKAMREPEVSIVAKSLRAAQAVKMRLPIRTPFAHVASSAVVLRGGDLRRRSSGSIEALFRERLAAEGIGILMSPPTRHVPGILIGRRKPDGVYPDPALEQAPTVYFEIKNVRRVADDIQKRLYEVAEASLEMKFLYGALEIRGLGLRTTREVLEGVGKLRAALRAQVIACRPTVVVLMLCSRGEAERYREGAEAFVDRVFFQEEIEACLSFLKDAVSSTR
jgi:hypothetical protein